MDVIIALTGTGIGTAQDMTFAIPIGVFLGVVVASFFWLRSGHERSRRTVETRRQMLREQGQERASILEAHEPAPGHGEVRPQ